MRVSLPPIYSLFSLPTDPAVYRFYHSPDTYNIYHSFLPPFHLSLILHSRSTIIQPAILYTHTSTPIPFDIRGLSTNLLLAQPLCVVYNLSLHYSYPTLYVHSPLPCPNPTLSPCSHCSFPPILFITSFTWRTLPSISPFTLTITSLSHPSLPRFISTTYHKRCIWLPLSHHFSFLLATSASRRQRLLHDRMMVDIKKDWRREVTLSLVPPFIHFLHSSHIHPKAHV